MPLNDLMITHADKLRAKTGVTNKLSIVDMTRLLDDLKWNQTNLLKGTSNQWQEIEVVDPWIWKTSAADMFFTLSGIPAGTKLTYSAAVKNDTDSEVELQMWMCDSTKARLYSYPQDHVHSNSSYLAPGKQANLTSTIVSIPEAAFLQIGIYSAAGHATKGTKFQVKNERLYVGTEPGVWTPNPADIVGGVTDLTLTVIPLEMEVAA